jgi:hypothetical protein
MYFLISIPDGHTALQHPQPIHAEKLYFLYIFLIFSKVGGTMRDTGRYIGHAASHLPHPTQGLAADFDAL